MPPNVQELTPGDFSTLSQPLVVQARAGEEVLAVKLAVEKVTPLPAHRLRAAPFSLILRGPRSPALEQGTYSFTHPVHGAFDLFLVPVAQDAQSRSYEATFN